MANRKGTHTKKSRKVSLDDHAEKFGFVRRELERQEEFHPRDIGMSVDEYLNDYTPSLVKKEFAKSIDESRKVGRPRKSVRDRIAEFIEGENRRVVERIRVQDGTEANILRDLVTKSADDHDQRKGKVVKESGKKSRISNAFMKESRVSGITNVYEFQGRLLVMKRLCELIKVASIIDSDMEFVRLLWWYCKDSIELARIATNTTLKSGLTAPVMFQKERKFFGMINQLSKVKYRIRHVMVSTDLDFEDIRNKKPVVSLLDMEKRL